MKDQIHLTACDVCYHDAPRREAVAALEHTNNTLRTACASKGRYIAALEQQVSALEVALENGKRCLAAQGRRLKKARQAVQAAAKAMEAGE